jgi:hypothetical protein
MNQMKTNDDEMNQPVTKRSMLCALKKPSNNIWDKAVRKDLFKFCRVLVLSYIIVTILAACITALLYGAFWNPAQYYPRRINVMIVNRDVGGVYSDTLANTILNSGNLRWHLNNNVTNLPDFILDGKAWAGLEIPAGYSDRITTSLTSRATYNNSIVFYIDEGRSLSTATSIRRILTATLTTISNRFSIGLLTNTSGTVATVANPSVIVAPFVYREVNLTPVGAPGRELSAGLGLLYLFLIATGLVNGSIAAWGILNPKVKIYQVVIARILILLTVTAIVAIVVEGIILIYGLKVRHGWARKYSQLFYIINAKLID